MSHLEEGENKEKGKKKQLNNSRLDVKQETVKRVEMFKSVTSVDTIKNEKSRLLLWELEALK